MYLQTQEERRMGNAVYSSPRTRVFACSDLHVDHKTNWKHLCKTLKAEDFTADDVLIVAGDISTKLCYVKETLQFLCQVFRTVCYCPGNNELRLCKSDAKELGNGRPFRDSVEKFHHVLALCEELGVHTSPVQVNDVWIVPLFCWYTPSFDPKWDGSLHYKRGWLDFRACRWPEEHELKDDHDSISSHFLSLNDKHLSSFSAKEPQQQKVVITFSHFLPRFELLPPRWLIRNKSLPLVVGDARLDQQIRRLGARVHVFGHTHIDKDVTIDGVRYVQNAFGHPRERKSVTRLFSGTYKPKVVFCSTNQTDEQEEQGEKEEGEDEDEEESNDDSDLEDFVGSGEEDEEEKEEEEH
ncbi:Metallo-dependent protein [Balamuthia mandrillaris]